MFILFVIYDCFTCFALWECSSAHNDMKPQVVCVWDPSMNFPLKNSGFSPSFSSSNLNIHGYSVENRPPKRKLVFQPSIFRCELLVSGSLLGQWLNFKLFGITYLVGKISRSNFFFRVHWLSEKNIHGLFNQPPRAGYFWGGTWPGGGWLTIA